MEISVIADRVAALATNQAQTFAKVLICPVAAVFKHPVVNSNYVKTVSKPILQKRRRTRRKSRTDSGGPPDDRIYELLFGGEDGPPFGGASGGGRGGGSGGNNFGFGGFNWDESSSTGSPADPAFDVVYEVLCWIVFSNCLLFAFKKVVRIMAGGDPSEREKVPTIC